MQWVLIITYLSSYISFLAVINDNSCLGKFILKLIRDIDRLAVFPTLKSPQACVPIRSKRSEEHTSELQSLMRISYAVFCLKKKKPPVTTHTPPPPSHPRHHNVHPPHPPHN